MPSKINKAQRLQFSLMKMASFNEFDGKEVVESLILHKDLWSGAVMTRAFYGDLNDGGFGDKIDLISLRDIEGGYLNIDTLYLLPIKGLEDKLEELAKTWKADEIDWIGGENACKSLGSYSQELRDNKKVILRVWWD